MPTAIVIGATGILGREIVLALGKETSKWTKVYAVSRSKKEQYPSTVIHKHIDLTGNVKQMSEELNGVEAEIVFFAAYLQKDTEQENWDVNGLMLENFLAALDHTGTSKNLKRVVLVTGAKQYGLHLGRPKNPMHESDHRIDSPDRPPNFYYRQQDVLEERSKNASWDWVVTYPNDVIGYARNNFMNLCTSLGLYAAVNKELTGTLIWPGSLTFYHAATSFTSSKLHASFCLWVAAEPRASNQTFNVVNGDVETWENLWPLLAARFGCTVPNDQFLHKISADMSSSRSLAERPPIADVAVGLEGTDALKPSLVEARIDVTKWAQLDEVKAAWQKLAEREGLEKEVFDKATWGFLLFELGRNFEIIISMSKARKYGWTGYADTWESFDEAFVELEKEKFLPSRKWKDNARSQ